MEISLKLTYTTYVKKCQLTSELYTYRCENIVFYVSGLVALFEVLVSQTFNAEVNSESQRRST